MMVSPLSELISEVVIPTEPKDHEELTNHSSNSSSVETSPSDEEAPVIKLELTRTHEDGQTPIELLQVVVQVRPLRKPLISRTPLHWLPLWEKCRSMSSLKVAKTR